MSEEGKILKSITAFMEKATSPEEAAKNVNCIGRLFILILYLGIIVNLYTYFQLCMPSMLAKRDLYFCGSYTVVLLYAVYCSVYFHLKGWFTEPGNPEKVSMKSSSALAIPKDIQDNASETLKGLLQHRNKGFFSLIHGGQGFKTMCQKCAHKPLKPLRSHHCRACQKDVLLMDHHCAWLLNCVGLNNHRYFLMFISYLTFASSLMVFPLSITNKPTKQSEQVLYNVILGQNFALSVIMMMFCVWNWFLAVKGQTVIEFMQQREQAQDDFTFECPLWRENLYIIFGTMSVLEMILPVERALPLNGLEWTYLNYQNNDCESLIKKS